MIAMLKKMAPESDATLKSTLKKLGDAQKDSPASINFYAKDFESKDAIKDFIDSYNDMQTESGNDKKVVKSFDNIPGVKTTPSTIISVYDLINCDTVVADQVAIKTIEEVYA